MFVKSFHSDGNEFELFDVSSLTISHDGRIYNLRPANETAGGGLLISDEDGGRLTIENIFGGLAAKIGARPGASYVPEMNDE